MLGSGFSVLGVKGLWVGGQDLSGIWVWMV